jgi:hypothetical protein
MAAAIQLLLKTAVRVLPYDACEAEMKILKRCVSDSWSYCFFFFCIETASAAAFRYGESHRAALRSWVQILPGPPLLFWVITALN